MKSIKLLKTSISYQKPIVGLMPNLCFSVPYARNTDDRDNRTAASNGRR